MIQAEIDALEEIQVDAEPVLKWAGGKRQLLKLLKDNLPPRWDAGVYHEPFLGAGSLFFALNPSNAVLADANSALMSTYHWLCNRPELVYSNLQRYASSHSPERYYQVRERYNSSSDSAEQAARFIYLNRSCFNGIYRVNLKGKFNVPVGDRKAIFLPSRDAFLAASHALSKASLRCGPFSIKSSSQIKRGDFVYLDPPYPALNDTAYFVHYTSARFDDSSQFALACIMQELSARGVRVLVTNADTSRIRDLYAEFRLISVPVIRYVSCKSVKHAVQELLIKNY